MRTLGASVLAFEAILVLLAIPVAVNVSGIDPAPAIGVGVAVIVAAVAVAGSMSRPWAVSAGWVLQVVVILSGVLVPVMFLLGAMFAGLWYAAIRLGRQVDAARRDDVTEDTEPDRVAPTSVSVDVPDDVSADVRDAAVAARPDPDLDQSQALPSSAGENSKE